MKYVPFYSFDIHNLVSLLHLYVHAHSSYSCTIFLTVCIVYNKENSRHYLFIYITDIPYLFTVLHLDERIVVPLHSSAANNYFMFKGGGTSYFIQEVCFKCHHANQILWFSSVSHQNNSTYIVGLCSVTLYTILKLAEMWWSSSYICVQA